MLEFIIIVLFVFSVVLYLRVLRLRRLMQELDGAVRSQRRMLPEDSLNALRKIGALGLVESLNSLIDLHNQVSAKKSGYSNHVEAMLGAVQEAVIVFNEERVVEYANHSAEALFRGGQSIQGLRLEGVFRSLTLLELLDSAAKVERLDPTQIRIDQEHETFWFEASCAKVMGVDSQSTQSTLLVLHDITQLKALEVMRREFVANVSHELRTPLTIIKGFAETLIDDEATISPKARLRFTQKILNNAERLHVLVEDLLTISRLESRPDQVELLKQPLRPLLEEVADNYRARLKAETQRIELNCADELGMLRFDRYRINQVLDNLIENVFRYAPEFTCLKIEASVDPAAGFVECAVADDGPGIPAQDIPHVFERFYRVDKGRSRETGGTGLGLSIVKHIIQLHGGSVMASSQLGQGTRMSFTLPLV
jgi:signal transduction histidine kinase